MCIVNSYNFVYGYAKALAEQERDAIIRAGWVIGTSEKEVAQRVEAFREAIYGLFEAVK